MRKAAALLAIAGLAAIAATIPASAGDTCIDYKQIRSTHMVDRTTMSVKAWHDRNYIVRFTGECKVGDVYPRNHFVTWDAQNGTCLKAGDALPTSELGPCFVKSVTRVDDNG